ncbi:MAG: 4Fe-4S binding protein [Blautia sp.]|jgi:ferredoxin
MKLYQIYFSPTGGTKKVTDILGSAWDCEKEDIDLSSPDVDFGAYAFGPEDVCLVAVPSFGGRVPDGIAGRIAGLSGGGAKAVLICVYGNRAYEDTLAELEDVLSAGGFVCLAAVAAIAEHSIARQFAAGRPDAEDERELLEFAARIQEAADTGASVPVKVPGNRPYKEYKIVPMAPKADETCNECKKCVKACPVKAIDGEDPRQTDSGICISCMRCIAVCPQGARKLDEAMLAALGEKLEKLCTGRKKNELFL